MNSRRGQRGSYIERVGLFWRILFDKRLKPVLHNFCTFARTSTGVTLITSGHWDQQISIASVDAHEIGKRIGPA